MNRASFFKFFKVAKPLLNFYHYILCEVNSTLLFSFLFVLTLCLSLPLKKLFWTMSNDITRYYISIYSQRGDLLVRYFVQFQIFFKSSKMVNLLKIFKKEEELKGMEVASFHEFGHRSIAAHLSDITENYFLFCQDFFL